MRPQPEAIETARRLRLAIVVYTVNEPAEAARLLGSGVASVITDVPDVLLAAEG